MIVKESSPNIVGIECVQEPSDPDYGTCSWARFYFNLDRYELSISSDCGSYGYKWTETPSTESFLELMARCEGGYILNKIYGYANIFDYEATKDNAYKMLAYDQEDKDKLDAIYESIEFLGEYQYPETDVEFLHKFDAENDCYFSDTFELPQYRYPASVLKVIEIFENFVKPKIKELPAKELDTSSTTSACLSYEEGRRDERRKIMEILDSGDDIANAMYLASQYIISEELKEE